MTLWLSEISKSVSFNEINDAKKAVNLFFDIPTFMPRLILFFSHTHIISGGGVICIDAYMYKGSAEKISMRGEKIMTARCSLARRSLSRVKILGGYF